MKNANIISAEVLRIHPPFDIMTRECTDDYKIEGTNVVIEKGTLVLFSVTGPSYDPRYYEQPETFNPDRLNDEHSPNLVFGDGPRNCVGMY